MHVFQFLIGKFLSQERAKEDMKKRHKQERENLGGKLDNEDGNQERDARKELDSEMEKILREKRNRQAADMAARTDFSDDQLKAVRLSVWQCGGLGYLMLLSTVCYHDIHVLLLPVCGGVG